MIEIVVALGLLLLVGAGARSWATRGPGPRGGRTRTALGIGERVLVAVSHPASGESLGEVASALARPDAGHVAALTVIGPADADADDVRSLSREAIQRCEAVAVEGGLRAQGRLRVDTSTAAGILHETVERDASLLLLGWPRLGADDHPDPAVADAVAEVPCPLLLARLQGYQWRRIVLRVPGTSTDQGLRASLRLATDVAERLGAQHRLPVVCVPTTERASADPSQLIVSPVAPAAEAIELALRQTAPLGDVVLAVCHGPHAAERRALLSSAADLYSPDPS
ncbi:MAG: hypothetical protein JJT89_06860 [Nitriliruptoraceae bacterium]|nr:hypothetical protein [Nitriliruptoraceae bacterium]